MGNVMGKKKPLKEVLRENKRMITRAVRELDREKQGLEKEEQRLTIEIKKAARENQMQSVKIMAKVSRGCMVVLIESGQVAITATWVPFSSFITKFASVFLTFIFT